MNPPADMISDTQAALLGLLRGDSGALGPSLWPAVVDLACRHGVAPLLETKPAAAAAPAEVLAALREERRMVAMRNLGRYAEFARVVRALDVAGVPVIPLKGLHLAEGEYRDISLRPMSDLDILVPMDQVAASLAVLRGLGYDGAEDGVSDAVTGLLDSKCNVGLAHEARRIWLEVHWALDEPGGAGPGPVAAIWAGARRGRLGESEVLLMPPELLLLHVCAHLACNHTFAFSLRALCDIAQIVRAHPDLDWNAVVAHGRAHPWRRGVAASLRLAREHLGVPVPELVLSALGADRLAPEPLAEAMVQLLSTTALPEGLATAPNLFVLAGRSGIVGKIRLLARRVLLPRAELAMLYGVPPRSLRILWCYPRRLLDLMRRYGASAWALHQGDPALAAFAARDQRLRRWIMGG